MISSYIDDMTDTCVLRHRTSRITTAQSPGSAHTSTGDLTLRNTCHIGASCRAWHAPVLRVGTGSQKRRARLWPDSTTLHPLANTASGPVVLFTVHALKSCPRPPPAAARAAPLPLLLTHSQSSRWTYGRPSERQASTGPTAARAARRSRRRCPSPTIGIYSRPARS